MVDCDSGGATALVCPVCGESKSVELVRGEWIPAKQPVYRCVRCRSAFFGKRNPEPDYWNVHGQTDVYADPSVEAAFVKLHTDTLVLMEERVPKKRTLLDIGCGEGLFLRLARERGWDAEGLEVSDDGAVLARAKSGCVVHVGRGETFLPDGQAWDVVCLWDVIEHCPEPGVLFRNACALLKPGGVLVLRTPNEGSVFRRVARLCARWTCGVGKGLLKYVYYTPHYVTFSAAGLKCLAKREALQQFEVRHEMTPLAFAQAKIRLSYRHFPGHTLLAHLLPFVYRVARWRGGNKLLMLAQKPGAD